jgi:hypothetical protein
VKSGQFIKTTNCYALLTNVLANKEGTIPVIVNGDVSTKGSVKVINRNTSPKEAREMAKINQRKRKSS